MPRTITALNGEEKKSQQFPVSFIYLDIPAPSGPFALSDTDIDLYLNRSTGALAVHPASGYDAFLPCPDLSVPSLQVSHEAVLNDVACTLSNIDESWYSVLYAANYRDAAATIWQGNLAIAPGDAEDSITAVGCVKVYSGRIDYITATHTKATLHLAPHITPWNMTIPYRTYNAQEFKFLPPPNTKLTWGFTEKTI